MIPKKPTVGEFYIDDGREYEVTRIVAYDRFEAKATGRFGLEEDSYTQPSDAEKKQIEDAMSESGEVEIYECQYCGRVCKSALGLSSHERNCPSNPQTGASTVDVVNDAL